GYQNTPRDIIFLTEEFFTPLYLLSAVFIGLGLFVVARHAVTLLPEASRPLLPGGSLLAALFVSLPVLLCSIHFVENNQRENYIAYDYATNTLRSLPQGAVLYTWGDSGAFPLWYLQGVEKMRDDLDLVHTPHLVFDWYLDGFPGIFAGSGVRNIPEGARSAEEMMMVTMYEQGRRRPVYVDFSTRYSIQFDRLVLQQRGIVYSVEQVGGPLRLPEVSIWSKYNARGLYGDPMAFRDLDTGKAMLIYANAHLEQGETLLRMGRPEEGLSELRAGVATSPEVREQAAAIAASHGLSL
ncbi:MAG TPA: DUF2723 domain-containing protein, partial [Verrucomicrobiae bacterium]|nr:DUF2723 domain-containing protein [Verrucomicrobiae bacterium]